MLNTWIALLRGINVVGRKQVPMKRLVSVLEDAGFESVRTYIQSGNVVFRSKAKSARTLGKRIAGLIEDEFGFAPQVMMVGPEQLAQSIQMNPFPAAHDNHKALHLFFLSDIPDEPDLTGLARFCGRGEEFALRKDTFYLYTPDGFHVSKVQDKVERYLGVHATARNWRTANQLLELVRSSEA